MSLSFPTKTLSGHELSPVPCTGGSLTEKKNNTPTKHQKSSVKQNKKESSLLPHLIKSRATTGQKLKKLPEIPLSPGTWVLNPFPPSGGSGC